MKVETNVEQENAALPDPLNNVQQNFEPLLEVAEAAKLLGGMHVKTLMRLARTNEVPAVKIGRHWYFRASILDAWVRAKVHSSHRPCLSQEIQ